MTLYLDGVKQDADGDVLSDPTLAPVILGHITGIDLKIASLLTASEVIGTMGSSHYAGTLAHGNLVLSGLFSISDNDGQELTAEDDGTFSGPGSGTWNRITGAYDVTFDAPAGGDVEANYHYNSIPPLYTVPAGKRLVITGLYLNYTAFNTVAVAPAVKVGRASSAGDLAAGYTEYIPATTLTITNNWNGLGSCFELARFAGTAARKSFGAGEAVEFVVSTGATASTLTGEAWLLGFLQAI